MPRTSSEGYSREDWRHMLVGSFIRERGGNRRVLYVQEIDGSELGPFILLCVTSGGSSVRIGFDDSTINDTVVLDRPRGRLVKTRNVVHMVRPLVRRTRRKGLHPDDYEVIPLNNSSIGRGAMSRHVSSQDRFVMAKLMFGETPDHADIRGNGSLVLLASTGDVATAEVNSPNQMEENSRAVIGQIAARMGYNRVTFDRDFALTETQVAALAHTLSITIPGTRVFWCEAAIGRVDGRRIRLDNSAELLAPLVSASYPDYEVSVNDSGV